MPLGPYLDAAAAARRFCDRMCGQWSIACPHLGDVADELVAAALLQRRSNLRLSLRYEDGVVQICLLDGRGEPVKEERAAGSGSLGALAQRIVSAHATNWGAGAPGSCELFWAELPVVQQDWAALRP